MPTLTLIAGRRKTNLADLWADSVALSKSTRSRHDDRYVTTTRGKMVGNLRKLNLRSGMIVRSAPSVARNQRREPLGQARLPR